jgi:hypothetical protein
MCLKRLTILNLVGHFRKSLPHITPKPVFGICMTEPFTPGLKCPMGTASLTPIKIIG